MADSQGTWISTPFAGAIGAVASVLTAVGIVEKRLAHVQGLERELGRLPGPVHGLYVRVTETYRYALWVLVIAAVLAALSFAYSDVMPQLRDKGPVIVLALLAINLLVWVNGVSWFLIAVMQASTQIAKWMGSRKVVPLNERAGFDTLMALVKNNEGAQPLVLNTASATSLVESIAAAARTGSTVPERAEPPAALAAGGDAESRSAFGNALLVGCVVEGAHHELRNVLGRRSWRSFYAVIVDLANEHRSMVSPAAFREAQDRGKFVDAILEKINERLIATGARAVTHSDDLRLRLINTIDFLAGQEFAGDVTAFGPGPGSAVQPELSDFMRHIVRVPGLKSRGMQTQFLKLAVVWRIFPLMPLRQFRFPYAPRLAALLLDRGVILAPSAVKNLTFDRDADLRTYNLTMHAVVREAIRLYSPQRQENAKWLPPASIKASDEEFAWWMAYELDLRLWALAQRLHDATDLTDDEKLTKWHCEGKQVKRL